MLNLNNTLDGYLKNVEVIGNTIQDTNNLADIRSVGDKVEGQELYKIELACYGDNILKPDFELGLWNVSNGTAQADSTAIRTKGFLRIRNQAHLVKRFDGKLGCQVILFDENFKYLGQQSYAGGNYVRYDNILPNAKYMKINFLNTTDLNLQCVLFDRVPSNINGVEFVEFQESELEIFSPVQLEKVDDVADRIICKDGVWGVDKKVDAEVKNNVLVNTRTNSEFISLPHDQQVKLRTFAGQTNIAFLTEIPGQIKAQVPKSLGATVNTHTEQIAELHNSLDRVKKLEETTVSIIETESNFTTVDATSNGYFEDVKLEGKTLVNLINYSETLEATIWNYFVKTSNLNCMLKHNTEYTIVAYVQGLSDNKRFILQSTDSYGLFNDARIDITGNGTWVSKVTTKADFTGMTDVIFTAHDPSNNVGTYTISLCLLEGDHTNNPPSYFEGLMSVGQDVEEVSVESRNSDETQSNKKPLLYYNPTTETWEKPILREWDTIEKHSDGKYYYHQRSEEIDYISGDEGLTDCVTDMNKTVKKISTEKVYECTNIDLMTYSGETNYIINSGAISPKSLLKVHNNISNVVKILQEKVSLLENTFIAGLKSVLSGDMYSLATILYPEDFEQNDNTEQDIMVIPE